MIEGRRVPCARRMANGAIPWQSQLHVRRIIAVREIGGVARVALRRCSLENIIDVAGNAGEGGMRARKRITCVLQVVELGIEPAVHRVAAFACIRQAQPGVVKYGSAEVLLMA